MAGKVTFDINGWTYSDYNDFIKAVTENDLDAAGELVTQVIVAWTYDKPFKKQGNALATLGFSEGAAVLRSVMDTLNGFIKTLDTSDVFCDLNMWTFGDFSELQKAIKKGDTDTVVKMLRQVCSIAGENQEAPLSAVSGIKFSKVVGELSGKVFQGKR